jgi:predicted DNA-binding transcriptional regulator AlpA
MSETYLKQRDILKKFPFSVTGLKQMISRGDFPAPVKLSERMSLWPASTVENWAQATIHAHTGKAK